MQSSWAGQGQMLSMARDSYLTSSVNALNEYCQDARPDLPNDKNYLYVCKLQVEADCSHGEDEEKKNACEILKRVKSLEKMVLVSDRNLSMVERVPVGINLSVPKYSDALRPISPKFTGDWIKTHIPDIRRMSEENWIAIGKPNKKHFQESAMLWKKARDQVNAQKVNQDCKVDTDCRLEFYGSHGCVKGHEGFFAMNLGPQSPDLISALANYNQIQDKAYRDMNQAGMCMAVMQYYNPKCQQNKCVGVTTY
jgi:hypothetical protein